MKLSDKIYVAGHRGLVGSAVMRRLEALGYSNLVVRAHAELELLDAAAVRQFFAKEKPQHVFLAAAMAGGIQANDSYPAEFFYRNTALQTNVMHEAWREGVQRLLFLGSSCIYPRDCPQPIKERYLLTGPLEPTNRPYAVAKIAGVEMCWSYNRQYGTRFLAAMPTNLYGPGDNFDLTTSHVIPALMRKMHEAKQAESPSVPIWGSGAPRREFLHSDDLADACIWLMNLEDDRFAALCGDRRHPPLINIGCGVDQTIAELAQLIARVVGYGGELAYDRSKPDGTPRKLLDVGRLSALGWRPRIGLEEGLTRSYSGYVAAPTALQQSS
ncbi:MAG: GDP-L-fucose synthase [Candidatus Parcubacteria bacterium]|nr:GDP-L-fucose synthase [Burkholderiales bacterium]